MNHNLDVDLLEGDHCHHHDHYCLEEHLHEADLAATCGSGSESKKNRSCTKFGNARSRKPINLLR